MKILLVTQEDSYYIPRLIAGLMPARRDDIVAMTVVPGEMSARNVKKYIAFMGIVDFARSTARYAAYRLLDLVFRRGIGSSFWSVRAVARRFGVPVIRTDDVNAPDYLEKLRAFDLDLIISIAAPQIFKRELLRLPKRGCINIHNSLLPRYQGMLPSFWVLANDESRTGTTVHYMNERIDAGDIILQEPVEIGPDDTLHSLVYRTKITLGPRMLLDAISAIEQGDVHTLETDWSQATYYSFPDREAVSRFRTLGRKFR